MRNVFLRGFAVPAFCCCLVARVMAQDVSGSIEGVVRDAMTHQPVAKAVIMANSFGGPAIRTGASTSSPSSPLPNQGPHTVATDANGAFVLNNLPVGRYMISFRHQNYPEGPGTRQQKIVEISASTSTVRMNVELIPGATVEGRIVDEDGDPMSGCMVQPRYAKDVNQGILMRGFTMHEDGTYRIFGIVPGKYVIFAECQRPVFQPRPLSEGPDPPPSAAYPSIFYSGARDVQSAQEVELTPGADKMGIDFQMRPAPVTHVHGVLAPGSPNVKGQNMLAWIRPIEGLVNGSAMRTSPVNPVDGTFDFLRAFPGSYTLGVTANGVINGAGGGDTERLGAAMRLDVGDRPLDVSVLVRPAMTVTGRIEIEGTSSGANQLDPSQVTVRLTSDQATLGSQAEQAQGAGDGTFSIKNILPGIWRIQVMTPRAFLKAAWLGSDEVTGKSMDLSSGTAAPLRLVVSTNTATVGGTAPPNQTIFLVHLDRTEPFTPSTQSNGDGQFSIVNVSPGRYRAVAADFGGPIPEEGGQEVTVGEGETATIEIKAATR